MDVVGAIVLVVVSNVLHEVVLFPYLQNSLIIFINSSPGPGPLKSLRPKIFESSVNFPKTIASSIVCSKESIIFWLGEILLKSPITPIPIVLSFKPE